MFEIDESQSGTRFIPAPTTFKHPDRNTRFHMPRSTFSYGIARKICEGIMLKKSLKAVCSAPEMPSVVTVTKWLANPKLAGFREMYYHARRVQAELLVDEILEIADDTTHDWMKTFDKHGEHNGYKPDNEAIQRSRVRIDTRKWFAAKMMPRIYGEKVDVQLDVVGDLAELLKAASNRDSGLPKPIEGKVK